MQERNASVVVFVFGLAIIFLAATGIFIGLYVDKVDKEVSRNTQLLNQQKAQLTQSERLNQELNSDIEALRRQTIQLESQVAELKNRQESRNLEDDHRQRICAEADYLVHLQVDTLRGNTPAQYSLSGFVIEYNGAQHILAMTAGHIRSSDRTITKITVSFHLIAETQEAEIVGYNSALDVALLRFKDPNFIYNGRAAKLGNSSELRQGDEVIVLGAPLGFRWTATFGEVINLEVGKAYDDGRYQFTQERLIMHSAIANPGNSGGPVLNSQGEVIGIHVMSMKSTWDNFITHIGLAVPINDVKKILDDLANGMQK